MSSQSALPDEGSGNFGLIETLRWSPDEGYSLFAEHIERLERSAGVLGFAFRRKLVERRLEHFQAKWMPVRVKKMRQNKKREPCSDSIGTKKALDHDDFGSNRSKVMNVIDSKSLERDAGEKPVPTFSHPALAEFAADFGAAHKRVRLVLFRGMALEMSASPLSASPPSSYRVAIAEPRHQSDELLLRHKTTLRDRYERPLAAAAAAVEADEILFLNERDELCEGARCNVFVMREGQLLTPPLSCGLLPGTLRARLLHQGHAREAMLGLADITPATQWFMGNSVRGLVPAALVAS